MDQNAAEPTQGELIELPGYVAPPGKAGRPRTGRVEKALGKSIKDAGLTTRRDAAAVALARSLARGLDIAERRDNAYAIAQVAPRMLETLERLGLLNDGGPAGAGEGDGQGVLEGLGEATVGDSTDAG